MSALLPVEALPVPIDRPVRLGVVGLGRVAMRHHLPSIELLRDQGWPIEVQAIADRSPAALTAAASRWPAAATCSDPADLFARDDLDGLVLLTHPEEGCRLLLEAIATRRPILVEKPVADSVEDALLCEDRAVRGGVAVQVGYNRPHHPYFDRFRAEVKSWHVPPQLKVRFWRVARREPIFFQDTLVHPLQLVQATLGPLRFAAGRFEALSSASLDGVWRIDLTHATDRRITVEIDIRPATGMACEIYEAIGHGCSIALHVPPAVRFAVETALIAHRDGVESLHGNALVADGDVAAACYYGGFVRQMAEFVQLCAGVRSGPTCGLREAIEVLRLYEEIAQARLVQRD